MLTTSYFWFLNKSIMALRRSYFIHSLRKVLIGILLLGLLPLIFLSWKRRSLVSKSDNKLIVVTTTGIIGDAVAQITQGRVALKVLMNPGVDPHTYEMTVQDGQALEDADIIFYNGLHLEGKMHTVFTKVTMHQKKKKVYGVSDALSQDDMLIDPHFSSGKDPHIWHSVTLWKKAVAYISEQLQKANPEYADFYAVNTKAYLEELDALHDYIVEQISKIPPQLRVLVTAHDAFEYFGKTYGLVVKSYQGVSTTSEPSLKDRQDLTNFIIRHQVKTIFAETSVPTKGIYAVLESCRQAGYQVESKDLLYSDALGEKEGAAGTYIGMMRTNVDYIVTASQSNV